MTLMMTRVGQVILGIHNHLPPTDEEWDRWLGLLRARPSSQRVRVLVEVYDGGGPDARQRKQLRDVAAPYVDYRTAVFTESVLTRGIITAVAWLGVPVRGFGFGDHSAAFRYLELGASELKQVVPVLDELRLQADVDVALYATTRPRVSRLSLMRRSLTGRESGGHQHR